MPNSQNLVFSATVPKDAEFDHPAGASLVRKLSEQLKTSGWNLDEMDNWRDCGWSVSCRVNSSELEIVLSQMSDGEWMLQVAPLKVPGIIGGLFGSKASATANEVYQLALAVHRGLSDLQSLGKPRWRWDGMPNEKNSTSEPQPASSKS